MTLCNEATLGLVIAGSLLIVIKEDWKKTLAAMFAMLCAGNSTSAPGQGTHAALPNKSRNCKVGHPQLFLACCPRWPAVPFTVHPCHSHCRLGVPDRPLVAGYM